MTGAGTADFAFGLEDDLAGSVIDDDGDGNPDYWAFGRNPSVTDLSLQNALQRMDEPDAVESVESIAQNFEGAVNVDAVVSADVHDYVERIVFNDAGSGFTPGRANSARIFAGVNYLDGTVERELQGCIPLDYSVSYEQGGLVTYSLAMAYANEVKNASISPTNVTAVSDGTSVPHHGVTLTLDGATVAKLQSAELAISDIARFHRDPGRHPVDAVIATPTTTLDTNAIITGPSRQELAYGGAGVSEPQDTLSSVAASLELAVDGQTVSTYNLPKLKAENYSWADIIEGDSDAAEDVTWHVNGGVGVA